MEISRTLAQYFDPRASTIRVSSFVLTWPRLLGLSLPEVAHASGLPLQKLEGGEELSYDETIQLWEGLDALTGDPAWGVDAGSRFTIDQMGVVGPALAASSHLDAAIDVLVYLMNHFVQNADIRRVDTATAAGIAYRMPTLRSRHGADTIFAATVALVRHCTGAHVVPHAIDHQMPRAAESRYRSFFGVTPRWDRPCTQLLFAREDLLRPFLGASPVLARLLTDHAPRMLAPDAASASTFEQDFRHAFWVVQQDGTATLDRVAEVLGVGGRTLQRKLASQGSSFAARRAELLAERADLLLREGQLSISGVGERLGFSSRGAFERAYLRWSGKRPRATRDER